MPDNTHLTTENTPPPVPTLDLPLRYEYDGKDYGPGTDIPVESPVVFTQLRRAALADTLRAKLAQEAEAAARKAQAAKDQAAKDQAATAESPTRQAANAAPETPSTPTDDKE